MVDDSKQPVESTVDRRFNSDRGTMETYHMDGCMGSKTAVAHAKYAKCCALKPRAGFAVVEDREVDQAFTTNPNYVQHSKFQGKARLRGAHEIKAQSKRTGITWSEIQQSGHLSG